MNRSGEAVGCLVKRWELKPTELLLVCDDVSLPLGRIRVRPGGSDGGHRGLSSVLETLETPKVARLRVGIGSDFKGEDLTDFVLSDFKPSEGKRLGKVLGLAQEACEVWVSEGLIAVMNRFNAKEK